MDPPYLPISLITFRLPYPYPSNQGACQKSINYAYLREKQFWTRETLKRNLTFVPDVTIQ